MKSTWKGRDKTISYLQEVIWSMGLSTEAVSAIQPKPGTCLDTRECLYVCIGQSPLCLGTILSIRNME